MHLCPNCGYRFSDKTPGSIDGFEEFWTAYRGGRVGTKATAMSSWARISPDDALRAQIMAAVEAQKRTRNWILGFKPMAATWLNQRRWEERVEPSCCTSDGLDRLVSAYLHHKGLSSAGDAPPSLRADAFDLLALFGGDDASAAHCIRDVKARMEGEGMSWTLRTVIRWAPEWMGQKAKHEIEAQKSA